MTDVDWELVFRWLGDECTAAERERFERWLAADPDHRRIVDAAVAAAGRTLEAMPASTPRPRVLAPRRNGESRPAWLLPAAATIVIAVGASLLMKYPGSTPAADHRSAALLRTAQTVRGGRQVLRLADGTRVVLGPASTLRYPAVFGAGAREVELTGEGFFDVVHDAAHPFRVRAGFSMAEDVGTAFGVRAYPEDSLVRVVVREGSVSLGGATSAATHAALLVRGQLGTIARGAAPSVRRVNVDGYLAWIEGRLAFDDTPLGDVVAQLERWYDAPVRIADPSLASRTLTASFTNEPLDEVLSSLAAVLDVRFDRMGDTIVVHAAR